MSFRQITKTRVSVGKMVFCVAFNCNTRSGQGISLYTFPKNQQYRKAWVVAVKRSNFVANEYSRLCAKHFAFDQFTIDPRISSSLKFTPKQRRLKPDESKVNYYVFSVIFSSLDQGHIGYCHHMVSVVHRLSKF